MTTSLVPGDALAAMDADDFHAIVRDSLGPKTDPAVWDALTDPAVIARTRAVLAGIHVDVQNQLNLRNAELAQAQDDGYAAGPAGKQAYFAARAAQGEWRRRAAGFRRIVEQRMALVKARTPRPQNQPAGTGFVRKRSQEALAELAHAVAAHRDKILSGNGGEDDDETLWERLNTILMPDGNYGEVPLAEWLDWRDAVHDAESATQCVGT